MLNLALYRNTAETRRRVRTRPRGWLSPTAIGIRAGQLDPFPCLNPAVVVTDVYTTYDIIQRWPKRTETAIDFDCSITEIRYGRV